jgi:hypothetical protein
MSDLDARFYDIVREMMEKCPSVLDMDNGFYIEEWPCERPYGHEGWHGAHEDGPLKGGLFKAWRDDQ